jgi:uncharacterized protein (DUF924 family)
MKYQTILDFWFQETPPNLWFAQDDAFDQKIKQRFSVCLTQAAANELWTWRSTAAGRLAEIIVLDQFSRNIYRHHPAAFTQDAQALCLAQEAIRLGLDQALPAQQRCFLYLPFMHSESPAIHALALNLFSALGDAKSLDYEIRHKRIIDRFGRYPHRNAILGRTSTPEEVAFLQQPNSRF